jgi:5-methylcytosine-specific restriction endonuclease McrA
MSHQETITAITDELTNAIQSVVETFEPYRADHRPDCSDFARWLIWNNQTSERLGIVALAGPQEHALTIREQKVLLRTRAMDLLRNVA